MLNKQIIPKVIMGSFLVAIFLTASSVNGITALGPLYTCQADPGVDGLINKNTDWKEGVPIDVTLYCLTDQANSLDIELMSVYGADYLLYYGITFADTKIGDEDYFEIVFREVEGEPLVVEPNVEGKYGKEHDVKRIWMSNNYTEDDYTSGIAFNSINDPTVGGFTNVQAACQNNGTHTMIEFATPMNSGDTAGFDLQGYVNGTLELFLWYYDYDLDKHFSLIREHDNDWDYIEQKLNCTAATPLPIAYILLGFLGIATSVILIKKRRK